MINSIPNRSASQIADTIRPASQVDKDSMRAECSKCIGFVINAAGLGLLIAGCVGAAGLLPGPGLAWAAVGVGGGGLVLCLAKGNFTEPKRIFEIIIAVLGSAALVTIGSLGGVGVLSSVQVGWAVVGINLAMLPVFCGLSSSVSLNEIKAGYK